MLVLSRRSGESIMLPNCEVSVTILRINGGRVQIGIDAPQHVDVHRAEVWKRIQSDSEIATAIAGNLSLPKLPK